MGRPKVVLVRKELVQAFVEKKLRDDFLARADPASTSKALRDLMEQLVAGTVRFSWEDRTR